MPLLHKLIGPFYRKDFKRLIYWFIICFITIALVDFLQSPQDGIQDFTRYVIAAP